MHRILMYFGKVAAIVLIFPVCLRAQNIYELRLYSDEDWLNLTTEQRLRALNTSNNRAKDQTLFGNFGTNYDLYPRWGYDYYEMNDKYETYAFRGFQEYNVVNDRRNKWYYNNFGDRLTKLTYSANILYERHSDDGSSDVYHGTNYKNTRGLAGVTGTGSTDGIWVARESTNDWAVSAVAAGALRTKFTPLTLSIPNLNGTKIDFQSDDYQISYVSSTLTGYRRSAKLGLKSDAFLLKGLQLRRKFGALTLGANYVNMYNTLPNRNDGTNFDGSVGLTPTPMIYVLRVCDDSPWDSGGPIIHKVRLKVNGVYRDDIRPTIILDDLNRELNPSVSGRGELGYLNYGVQSTNAQFRAPRNDQITVYERTPKYLDYLYLNDFMRGWNTKNMSSNYDMERAQQYYTLYDPQGQAFQVNGNQYVVYVWDITTIYDKVRRVEAEVTVANDYKIQLAEIMTTKTEGGNDYKGTNLEWYSATFWHTLAEADGNVKDSSNLRTVKVDFGFEVANLIYGFDAHFNYFGFKIDGEFVINTHRYMYPDGVPGTGVSYTPILETIRDEREGHRSSLTDKAYYLIAQKDWYKFGFTGEYFKMGKFYRPHMMYYTLMQDYAANTRNDYFRMSTISDNDDNDQYPDVMNFLEGMQYSSAAYIDPDGVFPGNDSDHDGFPDNEKNDNAIPDYREPFLMFGVDPDEFVFGDDFNNNNIPDFREDDMKDETPYDLDRQGHHWQVRVSPIKTVDLKIGSFRTRGEGIANQTDDDYFKAVLNYNVFMIGTVYGEYRYERIQDNIADTYVIWDPAASWDINNLERAQTSLYSSSTYYDEREYRNSRVHKFFLDSKMRAFPSITVENHIKYERNHQVEGTMYDNTFQPEDQLNTLAMVNKFAYTKQVGEWTFSPGIKFRLYKKDRSESLNPLEHYMYRIPLMMLRYTLSPSSKMTFGIQGFPKFEMQVRDYVQSQNDFKQINYVIQFENRTNYFGYDTWGAFGFQLEQFKFDEAYRHFEDYKTSSFFVRIFTGY